MVCAYPTEPLSTDMYQGSDRIIDVSNVLNTIINIWITLHWDAWPFLFNLSFHGEKERMKSVSFEGQFSSSQLSATASTSAVLSVMCTMSGAGDAKPPDKQMKGPIVLLVSSQMTPTVPIPSASESPTRCRKTVHYGLPGGAQAPLRNDISYK